MTLAAGQHGVVARAQLLRAGISPGSLDRRLRANQLRPLHRGVYLVGPVMVRQASAMAAALACGKGAVVSHRSAAELWGLLPDGNHSALVDVIVRGDGRKPGIRIHRIPSLRSDEVTELERIPVTTCARTLVDVASATRERELERAVAEAFARRRTSRSQVLALLRRHASRPGVGRLRALLDVGQPAFTRSEAEERFLALIRKAQLSMPEVNVRVGNYEVDFLWRNERLVTEIDGFAYHSSTARFENDRRRDAVLAAAGVRVLRVTWRQLMKEPEAVLVRLAQALARTTLL